MTLLSADGTLLMRAPFDIDTIGQSLRKSTVFKQFPGVQSGWYETASILNSNQAGRAREREGGGATRPARIERG